MEAVCLQNTYTTSTIFSTSHHQTIKASPMAFQQSVLLEASPRIATAEAVLKVFSRCWLISNWTDNHTSLKIQQPIPIIYLE